MISHAHAARPAECCGVLIGKDAIVVEAAPARNLAVDPGRYLIDPADHIEARRLARARGLDVVGFYHSHPHSPPVPSETDLREAMYEDSLYVIVGLGGVTPEIRSYRLRGGAFVELELVG